MKKWWISAILLTAMAVPAFAQHEAEGEEKVSLFAGTAAQSIAAVVVFAVLFVILYKMAWGPILKGLQNREAKIKGDLEQAEKAAKDATAKLAEYQARLTAAQGEAMKIMDQGRVDAQRIAESIKAQTQEEITAMKKRAEADIRTAQEHALNEIYARTATLATDVAGKILKREIRADDQEKLVEESLSELRKVSEN